MIKRFFTFFLYILINISISQAEIDKNSNVQKLTKFTSGTGFYINKHNIVTNEHVVKDCKLIKIKSNNKYNYASIYTKDEKNDLAILSTILKATNIPYLRKKPNLEVGEPIIVVGFPLKNGIKGKHIVKNGIILNLNDFYNNEPRIQFTDTVEKGNSGGPLIDNNGNIIGVIVGKMSFYLTDSQDADTSKLTPIKTTSVAIAISTLTKFLDQNNIDYKTITDKVTYQNNPTELAKKYVVNIHCIK